MQKNFAWSQKWFVPTVPFLGIQCKCKEYPPSPWSIGIITLRGNMKLNLVTQSVTGKILISKSLSVAVGKFRLPVVPWKSSAFSLCGARADVTLGCGNSRGTGPEGACSSDAAPPPWRATFQASLRIWSECVFPALRRFASSVVGALGFAFAGRTKASVPTRAVLSTSPCFPHEPCSVPTREVLRFYTGRAWRLYDLERHPGA